MSQSTNRRPVEKIDANGAVLRWYPSLVAAAKDNDMYEQEVYQRCKGRVKNPFIHRSFTFRYDATYTPRDTRIAKVTKDGEILEVYSGLYQAAEANFMSVAAVFDRVKGSISARKEFIDGFSFRYAAEADRRYPKCRQSN